MHVEPTQNPLKPLVATGLLLILLYQLIGLPVAVLTFEQSYKTATLASNADEYKVVKLPISLPYTSSWDNPDGHDGLVRDGDDFYNVVHQQYANDTLYTLLKTNQNARDRFFDLANQMQQLDTEQNATESPLSQLLKLLQERITTYLLPISWQLSQPVSLWLTARTGYADQLLAYGSADLACPSPPPK